MYFRLENKESQKAQEIGNLIRAYNRSKREEAESEPLNLYVEGEKGQSPCRFDSRRLLELARNRVFICKRGTERARNRFKTIAASRN